MAAGFELGLAARELVADEELLDDPAHLGLVEEVEAAPPALERQEALARLIDVGVEVVVLAEEVAAGVELLEVADQVGSVELPVAQVHGQQRRRDAAHQAAAVAHRVGADLARPGRHRRAVDDQRPRDVGVGGGQHQRGPAALAVAEHDRLGRLGVAARDLAQELGLGAHHIGQGLARFGMLAEDDEVDRVAAAQCNADLAVGLEAADAGAVARARIDDHVGALPVQRLAAVWTHDLEQLVVGRTIEMACVEHQFIVVVEHRRSAGLLVGTVVVGALAQHVDGQRAALRRIDQVLPGLCGQAALLQAPGELLLGLDRAAQELDRARGMLTDDLLRVGRAAGLQALPLRGVLGLLLRQA